MSSCLIGSWYMHIVVEYDQVFSLHGSSQTFNNFYRKRRVVIFTAWVAINESSKNGEVIEQNKNGTTAKPKYVFYSLANLTQRTTRLN